MKKNIKSFAFTLIAIGLMAVSCKKNFEAINTNVNRPENIPNSYLLTNALRGIMDNTCDIWWGGQVGNQLGQYWSSNQYTSESRYAYRTSITNGYWNDQYAGGSNDQGVLVGGLKELQTIIANCTSEPAKFSVYGYPDNQIAVAKIVKVWLMQNITDTWGDVPYSEALLDDNRTPKYDKQADIYVGLLNEINEAISKIDDTEAGPDGDIVYAGDMTLWRKLANSVKMRIALRMVDKDATKAQAEFTAAMNGAISSNAENALLTYGTSTDANLVYSNYEVDGRNDYAASNIMVDVLTNLNDPRIAEYYALPLNDSVFVGEVYGLSDGNAASTEDDDVSQRSSKVLSATHPGIFMDYAQVEFMMAEAAERGWTSGAQAHYDAGITASMNYWGITNTSAIAAYIAQANVNYTTASGSWKERIGKQKWIALYDQGVQGWTEWRRLDFGILQPPADGSLDGVGIPLRMKYPKDEQTLNGASYNAAVSSQGADIHATRMWWDLN